MDATNETYDVKRQLTYLIVPFAYDLDFGIAKDLIKSEEKWANNTNSPKRLFEHVNNLLSGSENIKGNIGHKYSLNDNYRLSFGLPNSRISKITYKDRNEEFNFSIREIKLYIFETQVGFLVFEIDYGNYVDLDSLIRRNYLLKKIQNNRDKLSFIKNRTTGETIDINFSKLVSKLTDNLKVKTFFDGNKDSAGYALVYNVTLINKKPDEEKIKEYLYWLRRSFKESYLPSSCECEIDNNPEIIRPFENSFWGVSLEGISNFIYMVENEKTNRFFSGNYFGNIKDTYFYTYMIALHQRYALLYLSILASEIKLKENSEIDEINRVKEKIVLFNLRCSFKHVTNTTHHAKLYEMIRKNLSLEEMMNELHFELSVLSTMVEMKYQTQNEKIKDEENKRQNKFNTVIILATTAFVMVSTAADAWSVLTVFKDDVVKNIFTGKIIAYLIVLMSIIALGFYGLVVYIKNGLWKSE